LKSKPRKHCKYRFAHHRSWSGIQQIKNKEIENNRAHVTMLWTKKSALVFSLLTSSHVYAEYVNGTLDLVRFYFVMVCRANDYIYIDI